MRKLHFTLEKMEFLGGGEAVLAGRNCGDEIRLGDHVQYMAVREGSLDEEGVFRRREEVSFQITHILFYGKAVEVLDPGMTAGLTVTVGIATGLRFGWHLFGENE